MQTITLYLIKENFLNKPRYEINGLHCKENANSIFNDGVIFEENKLINKYLQDRGTSAKRITKADSEYEIYFRETDNHHPWWKSFWKIQNSLQNKSTDVIVIISHLNRIFIVAHGHGRFLINPLALEVDFGLKAALNAIDSTKIRSTGLFTPSDIGMRTKKQTGRDTKIEQYEINIFNSLLKDIAGQVKSEYHELFRNIDGADCLKFNYSGNADSLLLTLSDLKLLYESKKYQKSGFKWIDNFREIRDKDIIKILDNSLISSIKKKNNSITLSYPAILPSTIEPAFKYSGFGKPKKKEGYFRGLDIEKQFYQKIEPMINTLEIDNLKSQQLILLDEETKEEIDSYKIYQCLYSEVTLASNRYFLEKGVWYRVDSNFLREIDKNLSSIPIWEKTIQYNEEKITKKSQSQGKHKEYIFNLEFCNYLNKNGKAELLDVKLIPFRNSTIEICDVIFLFEDKYHLFHNKKKYSSSSLSHLFSQGNTSAELLLEETFRKEANKKINSSSLKFPEGNQKFNRENYIIIYGIISKKNSSGEFNLPLFSKINLDLFARNLKKLNYTLMLSYFEIIDK
ncbi:DUF6119 family protein (plasmid) [Leptospira sp. WS60.C2]